MKKEEAWTAEAVDFIHKLLTTDKVFVSAISGYEPYYIAQIVCNDTTYVPPLFWRITKIYADDRLHIVMEINVSDLYRLVGV